MKIYQQKTDNKSSKKRFLKCLLLISLCLLLSGCANINTDITIHDDETGDVSFIIAVPDKYFAVSTPNANNQTNESETNTEANQTPTSEEQNTQNQSPQPSSSEETQKNADDTTNTEATETKTEVLGFIDKADFENKLKQRFKDWKFEKLNQDGVYGFKISADESNEMVKQYLETNLTKTNSGIGYIYEFKIDVDDFFPPIISEEEEEQQISQIYDGTEEEIIKSEVENAYMNSSISYYQEELANKDILFSVSVTMPGNLDTATYSTSYEESTVTIDYNEYAKSLTQNTEEMTAAQIGDCVITSRQLGGFILYIFIGIGACLAGLVIYFVVRKIQKGPF